MNSSDNVKEKSSCPAEFYTLPDMHHVLFPECYSFPVKCAYSDMLTRRDNMGYDPILPQKKLQDILLPYGFYLFLIFYLMSVHNSIHEI